MQILANALLLPVSGSTDVVSCLTGERKPHHAGKKICRPHRGPQLHSEGGRFERQMPWKESGDSSFLWAPLDSWNGDGHHHFKSVGFPFFLLARKQPLWLTCVSPLVITGATPHVPQILLARSTCALSHPSFPLLFWRRLRYFASCATSALLSAPGLSCSHRL